jgi:histidyl-tRNA synthetase
MGAVGFAMGIERLMMAMPEDNGKKSASVALYAGAIGERGLFKAREIAANLRAKGFSAETDVMGRGVKAQMKYADKIGAAYTVIIGDNELDGGTVVVKNMETGERTETPFDGIYNILEEHKWENI